MASAERLKEPVCATDIKCLSCTSVMIFTVLKSA
jgi:hypothetical protein